MTKNITQIISIDTLDTKDIPDIEDLILSKKMDSNLKKKYLCYSDKPENKTKLVDLFNNEPDNFIKLFINLTSEDSNNLNFNNIKQLLNNLNLNFWDVFFRMLESNIENQFVYGENQFEYKDDSQNKLLYIFKTLHIYKTEIETNFSLKKYYKKNSLHVVERMKNLFSYGQCYYTYNYNQLEFNQEAYFNGYCFKAIEYVTLQTFNLDIWTKFITYVLQSNPYYINKLFESHKWVFVNIKFIDFSKFTNILEDRIEAYTNEKIKYFNLGNFYLDFYSRLCSINPTIKALFKPVFVENINKIVTIHGCHKYLSGWLEWYPKETFINIDNLGYHTLFDCVRYGNYAMVNWYLDNILDSSNTYEAIINVFEKNMGLSYVFNNKDHRILQRVLMLMGENLTKNQFKMMDLTLFSNYVLYNNFSKKVRHLFNFLVKYFPESFKYEKIQLIINQLLSFESDIKNKTHQPILLPILDKINKTITNVTISISEYADFIIHHKYLNEASLKTLLNLTNIKTNLNESNRIRWFIKFITKNILNINRDCVFSVTSSLEIIRFLTNYLFNKHFTSNNTNEMIDFLVLTYDINFEYFNIPNKDIMLIPYLCKVYNKTKVKTNLSTSDIQANILHILRILIIKKDGIKSIGCLKAITETLVYDLNKNYSKDGKYYKILDTVEFLLKNGYEFSECSYIKKYIPFYFSKNYTGNKRIFSSYYYSKEKMNDYFKGIKRDIDILNRKSLCLKIVSTFIYDIIEHIDKNDYTKVIILGNILFSLKNYDSYRNDISKIINDKELFANVKSENGLYKLSNLEKSNIKIFIRALCDPNNFQFKQMYDISPLLNKFHNSYKLSKKSMKKIKPLIKNIRIKLETIIKDFDIYNTKIAEHIKLTNLVNGIFKIKILIKKRISINFEAHMNNSKKTIKEMKLVGKNGINASNKKDNDETVTLRELDILFGDTSDLNNIRKGEHKIKAQITQPYILSLKSIFKNYNTHSIITQKIDGIKKKKVNLTNSYPKCHINNLFDVEYLEENNMHFIIGIENSKMFDKKTFVEISRDMRTKHDFTRGNIFPKIIRIEDIEEPSNLFSLIREEQINYTKYLKIMKTNPLYRGKLLWWPKVFFELKYNNLTEYIRLLSFFEEQSKTLGIFKNDGWILAHKKYLCNTDIIEEHNKAYKIKPLHLLTIDLLFKNNEWYYGKEPNLKLFTEDLSYDIFSVGNIRYKNSHVYRCYPVFEQVNIIKENENKELVGFEARELRYDRKHPNPSDITKNIIYHINNYFKFKDLNNMIQNSKKEYYHFGINDKNSIKSTYIDKLNPIHTHVNGRVIDLGAGCLNKTLGYIEPVKKKVSYVVSTDNDMNLVVKNMSINSNSLVETDVGYLDYTKDYNEYNKLEKQLFVSESIQNEKFNTILMMNCINFAFLSKESLLNLFQYLDLISKTHSKIIIRWMDLDVFQEKYNELFGEKERDNHIVIKSPHDSSFINIKLNEKINRIYYKWVHETPINETIIGKNELQDIFNEKKWKLVDYQRHKNYNKLNKEYRTLWNLYFKSFATIVFERTY